MNEQTLFAVYHPGVSSNPSSRVGSGIGKTKELLKLDSESHQVQFCELWPTHLVALFTELFYLQVGFQLSWIVDSAEVRWFEQTFENM